MALGKFKVALDVTVSRSTAPKKGVFASPPVWEPTAPFILYAELVDIDAEKMHRYDIGSGVMAAAPKSYDNTFRYVITERLGDIKNKLLGLLSRLDNHGWDILQIALDIHSEKVLSAAYFFPFKNISGPNSDRSEWSPIEPGTYTITPVDVLVRNWVLPRIVDVGSTTAAASGQPGEANKQGEPGATPSGEP